MSPMPEPHTTTKEDVATLLENFAEYTNPEGKFDPWFTLSEINQQFAWDGIPDNQLQEWLNDMISEGKVEAEIQDNEPVYRWLS